MVRIVLSISVLAFSIQAHAKKASSYFGEYKRPTTVPHPEDNKPNKARIDLGKKLYFDPRISGSGFISCATCHNPGLGWEDGLALGFGHGMKPLGRHTPTILNLAWAPLLMWDGRKETLEEQALGPIEAGVEMNMPLKMLIKKINSIKGYKPLFDKAYPGEKVTAKTVGKAIASFERTIVSNDAPFDKWMKGSKKAVSESAKRGFVLFNEKAECATCHAGWRFTNDSFQNIGVKGGDLGRYKELDLDSMKHAFKTPTLRNITERAPYMHNGQEATLESVVDFYDRGGDVKASNNALKKLNLTKKEKTDLVNFMKSLTSVDDEIVFPILPQ